jgi:hypothetical protein
MRALSWVIAMTLALSATSTYALETPQVDTSTHDKILVTRITTAVFYGYADVTGTGLFELDGKGGQVQQLTPLQSGSFYLSGAESDAAISGIYTNTPPWLARNYSPSGDQFLYFSGQAVVPNLSYGYSGGKYYVMDPLGVSNPLFPGTNDVAAPGYGYLTWQPGGNDIAYANSALDQPAAGQACVNLVHPDGSDARPLWCAPSSYTGPQYISAIRWAGNGKSLLAYVSWSPDPYSFQTDLYQIDASTGAGTLVSTGIPDLVPYRGVADVSYDGTKVIYQEWGGDQISEDCLNYNFGGPGATYCLKDMTTGQVTVVPVPIPYDSPLMLSPDGSELISTIATGFNNYAAEDDLQVSSIATGQVLRQLTFPPKTLPDDSSTAWKPVAWSSDGQRLLVNRVFIPSHSVVPTQIDVYIINVANGSMKHIGSGKAESWYQSKP